LSGGERQRVAIVRTLLSEPEVVLLDEPFAALDPHLVDQFLAWLEDLRTRTGVTMVLVTHDVPLAMRWADRVAVLADGRVVQVGVPADLYARPATGFVATFLGRANVLDAVVTEVHPDGGVTCRVPSLGDRRVRATGGTCAAVPEGRCRLVVRPHDLAVRGDADSGADAVPATVGGAEFAGQHDDLLLTTDTGARLRVSVPTAGVRPRAGDRVEVRWPPAAAHVVLR
jgi:ABC-type Fe3+/spermidine/putrescine transport system ATPase subunit